mmetsp:Transcript_28843/g.92899  ORF Transcript_28843/g.92899 Transcript_28843/m.92899 type:complete len:208 (+) Transcript_28843:273-896(+)
MRVGVLDAFHDDEGRVVRMHAVESDGLRGEGHDPRPVPRGDLVADAPQGRDLSGVVRHRRDHDLPVVQGLKGKRPALRVDRFEPVEPVTIGVERRLLHLDALDRRRPVRRPHGGGHLPFDCPTKERTTKKVTPARKRKEGRKLALHVRADSVTHSLWSRWSSIASSGTCRAVTSQRSSPGASSSCRSRGCRRSTSAVRGLSPRSLAR